MIYRSDCRDILPAIANVNLVVTSPPYNSNQEYETLLSEDEYFTFIRECFALIKDSLVEDGRICWVVAPTISRKNAEFPFPLVYITIKAAIMAGLTFWEEIIWDQLHSEAKTAWGSYQSASAPFIRHQTERILLFTKTSRKRSDKGISNSFKKKEFEHSTLDVWRIKPVTHPIHPCPFPLALAIRCIKLFSYIDDVVLDPFMGSGTVGEACKRLDRQFIGIEKVPKYFTCARNQLRDLKEYIPKKKHIKCQGCGQKVSSDYIMCPYCKYFFLDEKP